MKTIPRRKADAATTGTRRKPPRTPLPEDTLVTALIGWREPAGGNGTGRMLLIAQLARAVRPDIPIHLTLVIDATFGDSGLVPLQWSASCALDGARALEAAATASAYMRGSATSEQMDPTELAGVVRRHLDAVLRDVCLDMGTW